MLARAAVIALALWLLLTCWAATIGRYGGPDEPAHVLRAYAVAHGDLLGRPAVGLPPGYRTVTVPAGLGTGDPACYRHDPSIPSGCAAGESGGEVTVSTSAGTNPPLYYALVGLPPRLVGAAGDPLAYRLVAAALVATVLALVVVRLRLRSDLALVAASIVIPSCWFLWSVVNPNALEIALVALAATGFVPREPTSDWDPWWIAIPLAIAVSIRPIAAVWAIALLVAIELDRRRVRGSARIERLVRWSVPAIAVAGVMAWSAWSRLVVDDDRTAGTGSTFDAVRDSIGGLPRSGVELVASMGWLEFWSPWPTVLAWVAAVVVLGLARPRISTSTIAVLIAALVAVPVAFEVVLYDRVGLIWQGRYSLPVAAIAIVISLASTTRPLPRRIAPAVVAVATLGTITMFWETARRYAVGTDGSWWFDGADRSSRWFGPGTWVVVFVVVITASAGLGFAGGARRRDASDALDTRRGAGQTM